MREVGPRLYSVHQAHRVRSSLNTSGPFHGINLFGVAGRSGTGPVFARVRNTRRLSGLSLWKGFLILPPPAIVTTLPGVSTRIASGRQTVWSGGVTRSLPTVPGTEILRRHQGLPMQNSLRIIAQLFKSRVLLRTIGSPRRQVFADLPGLPGFLHPPGRSLTPFPLTPRLCP